jgi:SAM-dependent methyltransferase
MEPQPWWAEGVDLTKPSAARVYDAHLGGSRNFQVDRHVAELGAAMMPSLPALLRANRSFLRRAVRTLARNGVTQFLDLGSGIPTVGNVHEIAQEEGRRAGHHCSVVYVDNDLVAVAHSQAMLRDSDSATAIRADFRDVEDVLTRPEVTSMLDFSRPVALLLVAVLHFLPDRDDPAAVIARYAARLGPGSHLVLSHACNEGLDASMRAAADVYSERIGGFWMRDRSEITALFPAWPLVPPGLVDFDAWQPDSSVPPATPIVPGLAGVARKPC